MTSQRGSHKALLGRKLGMTQVWDENGFFVPVTLVDVSTNVVTAVKSEETDGYKAIQIGYGQIDPTKVTKPLAGHFAKAGVTPRRHLVEVRSGLRVSQWKGCAHAGPSSASESSQPARRYGR